jgi:GWxTD domain-containing protein
MPASMAGLLGGTLAVHAAFGFPALGTGDIHFRIDHAAFRSGDGHAESEFYIELDSHELAYQPKDGKLEARVKLALDFFAKGEPADGKSYTLELAAEPGNPPRPLTQVLQLRLAPPEAADSVHAVIEDLNARKKGLFHMFTQSRRAGKAGARLLVRRFPDGELSVGDLEFARLITDAKDGSTFIKSGMEVEPNPGRVYGAPDPVVCTYLEVYDLARPAEAGRRRYTLHYQLRDAVGNEVRVWDRGLASENRTWADTTSFAAARLRAGTYHLGVVVKEETGDSRAAVEGVFEIVWAATDWVGWMADTDAIAPFLFPTLELDEFLTLGAGARERRLEEFWSKNDKTPGPGNETREEFNRRVAYANANFSSSIEPGLRTDRGRTYIKFGEPDELRREAIPVQGNDLAAAMRELDRETSGELRGNRGIESEDTRAFEVWIYNYMGAELFPSDQMSTNLGKQFVFVDDLGVGDFRLIRSSEKNEF